VHGQVDAIELFNTTLQHVDRSKVVIPNRKIVGEILHNYGTIRQLDLVVGVAYHSNLPETVRVVREVLAANPRVLKDLTPVVGVSTLADSSIQIAVKPWVAIGDYVPAQAEIYEALVARFREMNIQIPFPQREVRVLNETPPRGVAAN
jgi:small conductance mechanosensitive channel